MKACGYTGDFTTFFDLLMENLVVYSPYFQFLNDAWKQRNHPKVYLLFFEDMKKGLAPSVGKVASFLGKDVSDEMVKALDDHLSFKQMRNNPAVNKEKRRKLGLLAGDGSLL